MMDLRQAVLFIDENLDEESRNKFAETERSELAVYHHGFGTWIRNNCKLWDDGGTAAIVRDLKQLIRDGYQVEEIEQGKWTFNDEPTDGMADNRVAHPDQSSMAVMYVLHDWLNGILRRHDFRPMQYRRIDRIL